MNSRAGSGELRARILRATSWTLLGYIASQVLRLSSNLVMTRLLVPEMFGVMALANVIMIGLALFSDVGLNQSIIQSRRGDSVVYLNTVWTVQILRGFLLTAIALGIAVLVYVCGRLQVLPDDSAYGDPILPFVIGAVSLNSIISGFLSTRLASANRGLLLGRITVIDIISQVGGISIMIVWAGLDPSVWALVVGSLVSNVLRSILSHTIIPGEVNRIHWDGECFREIFGFGKWIFLTSILAYLAANGDILLLGSMVDAFSLGCYSIAFLLINALREVFLKIGGAVAYPVFSEVVRCGKDLKGVYYKFRFSLDLLILTVTGFMFSAGHVLVDVLYDARYRSAGEMVEILGVSLFQVRFVLVNQCFLAMGKPRLLPPIVFVRVVSLVVVVPVVFYHFGFLASLWAVSASALCGLPISIYFKVKYGLWDLRSELKVLPMLAVGYSLGMLASVVAGLVVT